MEKNDFKKLNPIFKLICRILIKSDGKCLYISCRGCPFDFSNSIYLNSCVHYSGARDVDEKSPELVLSAKEYIKLYK